MRPTTVVLKILSLLQHFAATATRCFYCGGANEHAVDCVSPPANTITPLIDELALKHAGEEVSKLVKNPIYPSHSITLVAVQAYLNASTLVTHSGTRENFDKWLCAYVKRQHPFYTENAGLRAIESSFGQTLWDAWQAALNATKPAEQSANTKIPITLRCTCQNARLTQKRHCPVHDQARQS